MGTRVRLTRSGGLAGLSMVASVDLDDLPAATAKKVRAALAEMDFEPPPAPAPRKAGRRPAAAAKRPAAKQALPDSYQYDLEITDGEKRSITVHDPVPSPEMQTLLDVLLPLAEPE
ncbi:MAG TPA: protealysin inhibitor emfourin [Acidimicrobiales bacterium]|nr:protealysin inhibitor emfourin [Acidimicrobiales bacterium]